MRERETHTEKNTNAVTPYWQHHSDADAEAVTTTTVNIEIWTRADSLCSSSARWPHGILLQLHTAANKNSKCSDSSHSNAKLQKSCSLPLLKIHQSHKAYST